MPDDPKIQMRDALQEIRNALAQARESVVLMVMRRNKVQEEVQQLERLVSDLDQKAALAERINNAALAAELRSERDSRQAELERARVRLTAADAEAESAKLNLPRQEAQLQQTANELQLRLRDMEGAQIGAGAEDMWSRATEKIRGLQHEADARAEIAGRQPASTQSSGLTPDQSAEEMLKALESRVGLTGSVAPDLSGTSGQTGTITSDPSASSMRYIEFDAPAVKENPPVPPTPQTPATPQTPTTPPAPPVEAVAPVAETPFTPAPVISPAPQSPVAPAPPPMGFGIQRQPVSAPVEPIAASVSEPIVTEPQPEAVPVQTSAAVAAETAYEALAPAESTQSKSEPLVAESGAAPEVETPQENPEVEAAAEVAAPTIITSVRSQGETSRMEPNQRVRVAAIGTGSIFRGAHLPTYPDIPQAQLVAFCDPDPQAHKLTKARYESLMLAKIEQARERKDTDTVERLESDMTSIRYVHDISEVIAEIKPDLLDICTQPFLHAPLSIQALEAGLNVMCEKPISRSWLETERLIPTIQRTGKLYQHNENWLWDKDYYTAKKLVDAGAIGEPILMFLATAHGGPEGAGKFWNSDFGGGGALLDNGIHAIGASWYISGLDKKPTVVKAAQPFGMSTRMPNRIIDGRFQKVTVDDDAHILIRFENEKSGAWSTAHVEGSWSHRDSPDTAIIGTTGKILFQNEGDRRYAVVYDAYEHEARRIEVSGPTWQHWPSSFYGEILNMVECVRNNVPSICSAQFGAECSAIVGASYLSEKNGRQGVHVDEFKTFARSVADRYPNDPAGADNALIETLLSAVRK